jgi:hypothetical protein
MVMQGKRYAVLALLVGALVVSSCQRVSVADKYHPAKIDSTEVAGIMRVTLDERAAQRIGVATAPVKEEQVTLDGRLATHKVVPYGAVMYDTKGDTWTFTNPQPLVYVRQKIVVEGIDGDRVFLSEGPATGTNVVTVGATELMGAEHKYGH